MLRVVFSFFTLIISIGLSSPSKAQPRNYFEINVSSQGGSEPAKMIVRAGKIASMEVEAADKSHKRFLFIVNSPETGDKNTIWFMLLDMEKQSPTVKQEGILQLFPAEMADLSTGGKLSVKPIAERGIWGKRNDQNGFDPGFCYESRPDICRLHGNAGRLGR
jgi:hypothetical protein